MRRAIPSGIGPPPQPQPPPAPALSFASFQAARRETAPVAGYGPTVAAFRPPAAAADDSVAVSPLSVTSPALHERTAHHVVPHRPSNRPASASLVTAAERAARAAAAATAVATALPYEPANAAMRAGGVAVPLSASSSAAAGSSPYRSRSAYTRPATASSSASHAVSGRPSAALVAAQAVSAALMMATATAGDAVPGAAASAGAVVRRPPTPSQVRPASASAVRPKPPHTSPAAAATAADSKSDPSRGESFGGADTSGVPASERLSLDRRSLTAIPLLCAVDGSGRPLLIDGSSDDDSFDLSSLGLRGVSGRLSVRRLRLLNCEHNAITAISGLVPGLFAALTVLDLYDNAITAIGGLEAVPNLRVLMLGRNRIRRVSGLDAVPRLDVLDLHSNAIARIDEGALGPLSALRVLNMAGNRLTRIEPRALDRCTALTELNVRRNAISGVAPSISSCTHLTRVLLSNNAIASFEAIAGLFAIRSLTELALDGNPVALSQAKRQSMIQQIQALYVEAVCGHNSTPLLAPVLLCSKLRTVAVLMCVRVCCVLCGACGT
jgi:hypothetical protein